MYNTAPENQWLNRAFKLACFIHRDRATAIKIATAALSKLEIAATAQDKRLYYTPAGRASARKTRNKVLLSEAHLLQRLIYVESEIYERQEEQRGLLDEEDMIIHFIKHLVRISIKRNSFYITLGLSRLLHNYTTAETQDIYNVVVQDPDRVRDDYYYRSRKAQLMRELKERFGDLLKVSRGQRGEERFHAKERPNGDVRLVENCLSHFTPWNTPCLLPPSFDPFKDVVDRFSFNGDEPDLEHEVEINRMHAILDPECYGRVVRALGFDQPEQRLEIPQFFLSGRAGNGGGPRARREHAPELAESELLAITGALAEQAARRRAATAGLLRVVVDGRECARLDLSRAGQVRFRVEEGAELIEVRTDSGGEDMLIATHFLALDELSDKNLPLKQAIVLEGGQELSFSVLPANDATEQAVVDIAYRETGLVRAASLMLRRLGYRLSDMLSVERRAGSSIMKPALALTLITLSAVILIFYLQNSKSTPGGEEIANKETPPGEVSSPQSISPPEVVDKNPNSSLSGQEPARSKNQRSPAQVQKDEAEPQVARLGEEPPSESILVEDEATRAIRREQLAAALPAVKRIYVSATGDEILSREVRDALTGALQSSGRFTVVANRDEADAVLNASVRLSKGKALVVARLVNANGEVIWPVTTKGSGEKYLGPAAATAVTIIEDLLGAVRKLESKRK